MYNMNSENIDGCLWYLIPKKSLDKNFSFVVIYKQSSYHRNDIYRLIQHHQLKTYEQVSARAIAEKKIDVMFQYCFFCLSSLSCKRTKFLF